jgi:hypothetical protein
VFLQIFSTSIVDGDSSYISQQKLDDYFVLDGFCKYDSIKERSNSPRKQCNWTYEVIYYRERAQMPERIPAAKCINKINCVEVYYPVPVWVFDTASRNWKMEHLRVPVACLPAEKPSQEPHLKE